VKKFVLAAAIGLLLAGCGSTGSGSGANPSPSPTSRGGLGFDVTAGDSDHTVTMGVGQRLEVILHAPNGMKNWTHPESSDPTVVASIVDPAAAAARGVTLAAFEAKKPGVADLTSNASPLCPTGAACPMYIAVYSLRVTVTR
jgi:hypothetical protein